jgi:hypothetical protein
MLESYNLIGLEEFADENKIAEPWPVQSGRAMVFCHA